MSKARRDVGIEVRHATSCASAAGKRCNCAPRYRGHVKDASGRKIRSHWTVSKAEAIAWRQEAVIALRQGRLRPPAPTTVKEAGDALVAGMRSGAVLDRSGKAYKPKTVRTYEHTLETYVYPLLGHRKLISLKRGDIQGFIEEMRASGASPSTVHNHMAPGDVASYLREIARVLKPHRFALIHHAGRYHRPGWRAPMTGQLFAQLAEDRGLAVEKQFDRLITALC